MAIHVVNFWDLDLVQGPTLEPKVVKELADLAIQDFHLANRELASVSRKTFIDTIQRLNKIFVILSVTDNNLLKFSDLIPYYVNLNLGQQIEWAITKINDWISLDSKSLTMQMVVLEIKSLINSGGYILDKFSLNLYYDLLQNWDIGFSCSLIENFKISGRMPEEIYNHIFGYFNKIGLNLNADFTNEYLKEVVVKIRKLDHLKFNFNTIDTRLIEKYSLLSKIDTNLIDNSFRNLDINLDKKLSFENARVVSSVFPKMYFKAVVIGAFRG